MAQDLVVGIDAGTTRVKALAVDLSGQVVAQAAEPTPGSFGCRGPDGPRRVDGGCRQRLDSAHRGQRLDHADPGHRYRCHQHGRGRRPRRPRRLGGGSGVAFHDLADGWISSAAIDRETFHGHVGMRLNNKPSVAKILWLRDNVASQRGDHVSEHR